jgi:murein DD-endopeptidase MepM/ murein hydrolase activator NlpD
MLPKELIYIIERHTLAALCVYFLGVGLIVIPLASTAVRTNTTRRNDAATPYYEYVYPIRHMPATATAQYASVSTAVWPMHGRVTTEFGVYHRPYQATHTGIDITSARPSGETAVTTFREGTVVHVVHSSISFGNHVIIDHGSGMTSLYGHLADISVAVGQHVMPGETIGHEGSTGASTGTHLHFEIQLKGRAVNPRQYAPGNP